MESPLASIRRDAIPIDCCSSGLSNTFLARKLVRRKQIMVRNVPRTASKSSPEARTLFISAVLLSDLYWAKYLIIEKFIPQSLNKPISVGGIRAIAYNPYWSGVSNRTRIMVPSDDMTLESATPKNRWNPPLAETSPILIALAIQTRPVCFLSR